MFASIRQAFWTKLSQTRAVHKGPNFDPLLHNRDELPIITQPAYQGNLKKVRRSLLFENTMATKRAKLKKKKNSA